jgi:hypothetical protein
MRRSARPETRLTVGKSERARSAMASRMLRGSSSGASRHRSVRWPGWAVGLERSRLVRGPRWAERRTWLGHLVARIRPMVRERRRSSRVRKRPRRRIVRSVAGPSRCERPMARRSCDGVRGRSVTRPSLGGRHRPPSRAGRDSRVARRLREPEWRRLRLGISGESRGP